MTQAHITLRDYFAAHAPTAPELYPWRQVSRVVVDGGTKRSIPAREDALDREVRWRWEYADAMMRGVK